MNGNTRRCTPLMTLMLCVAACDADPSALGDVDELAELDDAAAELDEVEPEADESAPPSAEHLELTSAPEGTGRTLVEGPSGLMVVTYEDIGGIAMVDGDIELGPTDQLPRFPSLDLDDPQLDLEQLPRALTPVPLWGQAWPNGVVYYVAPATGSADVDDSIGDAIATMEAETDLDFVAVPAGISYLFDHIYFTPSFYLASGTGSSDSVGRKGGRQYIRMSQIDVLTNDSPGEGLFLHELGHAVGLYHEHQRSDRDQYVMYVPWCVESGKSGNFDKRTGFALGPYDTSSIMHYGTHSFSNGCATLVSLTGASLGGGELSVHDIAALDWLASF